MLRDLPQLSPKIKLHFQDQAHMNPISKKLFKYFLLEREENQESSTSRDLDNMILIIALQRVNQLL